ncbi:MAG: beta-phosphoglucomutase [Ardenticatenaceae bacterium]|nr:beta-phosphoglucomutase [Ardenticatenaceae bacterium]
MTLQAVIFDLDGVITDTAEYHYLAWQQLADEEGLTFDRAFNEQLRGVSRRESLLLILNHSGRTVDESTLQEMMARKNSGYVDMLTRISPADLLPGATALLDALDLAGIPYALASASKNARAVLTHLGIAERFAVIADGNSVTRQKPAPDLFRFAAARLGAMPACCVVIEDAAAGIAAAQSAGMAALALGPAARFDGLLNATARTTRRDNLQEIEPTDLQQLVTYNPQWTVQQKAFDPPQMHHMETVFTTGNGFFASRGTFAEGYPDESAITFAHGVFDDMPVAFTSLVNLPGWLDTEITINGCRFQLCEGHVKNFSRVMDLQRGIIQRDVRWTAPDGTTVDLTFERFISYTREHLGALRLLITAVNRPCTVEIHSGINGHVSNRDLLHWHLGEQGHDADTVWLSATTRHTKITLGAAAMVPHAAACQNCPGHPRLQQTHQLEIGQTAQVDKLVAFTTSRDDHQQAADVVGRAQTALRDIDYERLKADHTAAWRALWRDCDVIIEGDDEAQLAVRFNLYQLLVAAPQRDERVSIGAKTLSGYGYFGHVFWDTEIFILPFFMYTRPEQARQMLMYRYHTLAGARRKAAGNGFSGAQFAWESAITGDEMTPTWVPDLNDKTKLVRIWTGDIQIHISADIAYAIMQYWQATGDEAFVRDYGAEIILDTARFWGSRAEREETKRGHRYAFRNVIGPDEYHDHVDNNSFTNYVARWHLQTALELLDWLKTTFPEKARELITNLSITDNHLTLWHDIIDHTIFLYDEETGLIDQFENFFELEEVSPEFIAQADRSLQIVFGIEGANRRQVLKQADVIMLLCLFRDRFDRQTWQTNWDTYMPKTDHVYGSSLGPSFHAWAACEMERPEEAYEHFMLAARADLRNPRGNAGDGIHAASAGGVWQAVVFGFAGLRLTASEPTVTPRLPSHWQTLAFSFYYQGQRWAVDIRRREDGQFASSITPAASKSSNPSPKTVAQEVIHKP